MSAGTWFVCSCKNSADSKQAVIDYSVCNCVCVCVCVCGGGGGGRGSLYEVFMSVSASSTGFPEYRQLNLE